MDPITIGAALFFGSLLFGSQINKEEKPTSKSGGDNKAIPPKPVSRPINVCPHCGKSINNKKED